MSETRRAEQAQAQHPTPGESALAPRRAARRGRADSARAAEERRRGRREGGTHHCVRLRDTARHERRVPRRRVVRAGVLRRPARGGGVGRSGKGGRRVVVHQTLSSRAEQEVRPARLQQLTVELESRRVRLASETSRADVKARIGAFSFKHRACLWGGGHYDFGSFLRIFRIHAIHRAAPGASPPAAIAARRAMSSFWQSFLCAPQSSV